MYQKNKSQADRVEEYGEYVLSRTVKSVHRTYFLDVRATKGEDLFVTITESRKRQNPDGTAHYDRHKIVLYKEDVLRFSEEFGVIAEYLREHRPQYFKSESGENLTPEEAVADAESQSNFESQPTIESDINFEDL